MRKVIFVILISVILVSFSGCFFKKNSTSSTSTNPVGPVITQAEPEIINNIASGTASLKVIITFPEDYALEVARQKYGTTTVGFKIAANVRASLEAPYVSATLFVNDTLLARKNFAVSGDSAEISFVNIPNSGIASVSLDLVGCNIRGFRKFAGQSEISAETQISVSPIVEPGMLVTADYRVLSEIGTEFKDAAGRTVVLNKICFNEAGDPVGFVPITLFEWEAANLVTGQRYFNFNTMREKDPSWPASDFKINDFAYLNGSFYVGGGEVICKVNPDMQTKIVYAGQPGKFTPAKDGDSLASATLPVISDMCVANGKIYVNSNMDTIVELDEKISVYRDMITGLWGSRLSVTENGDIFFVGHIQNLKCSVLKFTGKNTYVKIGPDEDYPNQQTTLVTYEGGYLIANEHHITQVFPDGSSRVWLCITSPRDSVRHYIYKNTQGGIYVVAESKIWRVN